MLTWYFAFSANLQIGSSPPFHANSKDCHNILISKIYPSFEGLYLTK